MSIQAPSKDKSRSRSNAKKQLPVIEESDDEDHSQHTTVEERKKPRPARKGQANQKEEYDRNEREIEKREFSEPLF